MTATTAIMAPVTVTGVLDGAIYHVQLTGDPARPVAGSRRVRALVALSLGDTVPLTPTGPVVTVAADDQRSLLALLLTRSQVTSLHGAPALTGPRLLGAADA